MTDDEMKRAADILSAEIRNAVIRSDLSLSAAFAVVLSCSFRLASDNDITHEALRDMTIAYLDNPSTIARFSRGGRAMQ